MLLYLRYSLFHELESLCVGCRPWDNSFVVLKFCKISLERCLQIGGTSIAGIEASLGDTEAEKKSGGATTHGLWDVPIKRREGLMKC